MNKNNWKIFLKNFWKDNIILCVTFLIITIFFLFQHRFNLGWDFAAYSLNADYLFGNGDYFEVYRAPIMSILLGILGLFGSLSHYIYILLVSSLFLYSTIKISDACFEKYFKKFKFSIEFNRIIFYLVLLTPFLIINGLMEGTELLALSFIQLFLASFLMGKNSGHFLGLAFLSRYNFLLFGIFLFFDKDYKRVIRNICYFGLVSLPWFLFNFIKWGNPFSSIVDSIHLNVISRQDMVEPFNLFSLLTPISYLLPIFILGVFAIFYFRDWKKKTPLLFFGVFTLLFWEVYNIPFKLSRYMFNLALPIAFFSLVGIYFILKNFPKIKKELVLALFILFIISVCSLFYSFYMQRNSGEIYKNSSQSILDNGWGDCQVLTNVWVPIHYYSRNAYPLGNISRSIEENQLILILRDYSTIDDLFSIDSLDDYPVLLNESSFFIIGKENLTNETCLKKTRWDRPRVSNPCIVISERFAKLKLDKPINKLCLLVSR